MAGAPDVTKDVKMKIRWTGIVLLLTIGLTTPIISVASDADVKRKYGLDTRGLEFAYNCRQVMSQRSVFSPNVSGENGCACVAQRLSPMSDAHLAMAHEITQLTMRAMIAQSSPAHFHEQLETLRRSNTYSRKVFSETLGVVHKALRYCGDPSNHPG